MNTLKSLLSRISQLSFDLRGTDKLKAYNANQMLYKLLGLNINWSSLPHSQLLNVLANKLGYVPSFPQTSWKAYISELNKVFEQIDSAYGRLNLTPNTWLDTEDLCSLRWYAYLRKNRGTCFSGRINLLSEYLKVRCMVFNRCKLSKLNFLGLRFSNTFRVADLLIDPENYCQKDTENDFEAFFKITDLAYEKVIQKHSYDFFKANMDWLYLFDCRLVYCSFLNNDFRNAIWHNVDFRFSQLSDEGSHGDIMGADFSFCDGRYSVFSGSYAREAKIYKCNFDYALFDHTNLIGSLFIDTSLKNTSFVDANVYNVSFRGCDLQGANFTGAHIVNVDCSGANLKGVKGMDLSLVYIDQNTLL